MNGHFASASLLLLPLFAACTDLSLGGPDLPDLVAPNVHSDGLGDPVSVRELAEDHAVLVNVWATWCAPCREEIPELVTLYEERASDGLEIVGPAQQDELDLVLAAIDEFDMDYVVTFDEPGDAMDAYGIFGLPANFLYAPGGELVWNRNGPMSSTDADFLAALDEVLPE